MPQSGAPYRTFYDSTALLSGGRTLLVQGAGKEGAGIRDGVYKYLQLVSALEEVVAAAADRYIVNRYTKEQYL